MAQNKPDSQALAELMKKIKISPPDWPDPVAERKPGYLTMFAPSGNSVYGYQDMDKNNPFLSAPPEEEHGGVIYFGNDIAKADFDALMRITGIHDGHGRASVDYAAFFSESKKPIDDGYLAQMRVVSKFGLRFMFNVLGEERYDQFPEQQLTVAEAFWAFIEMERKRWGTSCFSGGPIAGTFGGDGDGAREELAFGLMVENDYHNVYRIWSRAWLVTK